MDDPLRGTGRSTGLMLKAISEALLKHCTWVRFADHASDNPYYSNQTNEHAAMWAEVLEMLCRQIGLSEMRIRCRGNQVWIISLAPTITTPESAPQYPECPPLP